MFARNLDHPVQPQAGTPASMSEGVENPQGPGPEGPPLPGTSDEALKKKGSADWTLPPHLREALVPLNPKGGRAPKPPASTGSS